MNHAARRAAVAGVLRERDLDALLVTSLVNVRYLTGFTGSNAALLITADGDATVSTDGRYITQIANESPDLPTVIDRSCALALLRRAPGRVGFEAEHVTVAAREGWGAELTGKPFEATSKIVEALRVVKDAEELACLATACAITDAAFADLVQTALIGLSEKQIARRLEGFMFDHGADGLSFESIVASGEHSAIPHHEPTHRVLSRGDFLKLDFGALSSGYHADMTRTVVAGQPADWQRDLHELVTASAHAGRDALRAGATSLEVDTAARRRISDAGFGAEFSHGLGHGVGLVIHEDPFLGPVGSYGAPATLCSDTPLTVEPGVYLAGRGGVRVEDTLVVTDTGSRSLTHSLRGLLEVD